MLERTFLVACALVATLGALPAGAVDRVTILGGGLKGGPYQLAVGLAKVLADHTDIKATPQSAKGMPAQARIMSKDGAEFAFGLGGPVGAAAFKGAPPFEKEGAKPGLRQILSYKAGMFQWLALADSNIAHLRDVKGKKVSVGSASSTTQAYSRYFLPEHGLAAGSYQELTPGFTGGFNDLRNRGVDIHLTFGNPPSSVVQELAALKRFRLVDMDRSVVDKIVMTYGPGIEAATIAADVYGTNQANDGPVNTIAMYFGFSSHEGVSADIVYTITKALFENLNAFQQATRVAKAISLDNACRQLSLPLHEGAKRYYREIGKTDCGDP